LSDQIRFIKNLIVRVIVLGAVFVAAILISSRLINRITPDVAAQMPDSTFPLVYMQKDGTDFNCLHGYSREMDVSQMRYSITPLSADRTIRLKIQTFGVAIDSVSYEIVTIDGTKSLENTEVIKLDKDGDYLTCDLTLNDDMLMKQEYVMKVQVTTGGRNIYYYTHVLLQDGLHTGDYLNFAAGFWDKCINKSDLDTVGAAVEPDASTDSEKTLASMDIHDSVNQLTWADLGAQIFYKPTPRLMEINENTATLTLDYRISATAEDGGTELYNVHEYYRLRYTDSRVFLLNFSRTTDQIFNPENTDVLSDNGLVLGITQRDICYMTDPKKKCVAFVQENELWTCMTADGTCTRVFGFPQQENMDARDFYKENTIRILKVDDAGDVWFAVGGYMNRGVHEGDNGIGVYYYDAQSTMVSELSFLESDENTERLQMDLRSCLYLTSDGDRIYTLLDGILYSVSVKTKEVSTVASGINNDCYQGSESGRYFAWLKEGKMYDSSTLIEADFETGKTREIAASGEERLRPLTFMGETLVYGAAKASDIQASHGGNAVFPMYRLQFEDGKGSVLKTYQPDGLYVTAVNKTDSMLELTRVSYSGSAFAEASKDQIVATDRDTDTTIGPGTMDDSRRQTIVVLRLGKTVSFDEINTAYAKIVAGQSIKAVDMPENPEEEKLYYVYASGGLDAICTYPGDAVVKADSLFGVVVDHSQNYVWVRGDKAVEKEIKLEDVPEAMKAGTIDVKQLEAGISRDVVDLTGCTLDEVLYFVSHGRPVIASTAEGVKIIVGYDEYNTYLLNPGEDKWYYFGINDSADLFTKGGNEFYSYVDAPAE